jgi:hypothetical protein
VRDHRPGLLALAGGIGARALKDVPNWLVLVNGTLLIGFSLFGFGAAAWRHFHPGPPAGLLFAPSAAERPPPHPRCLIGCGVSTTRIRQFLFGSGATWPNARQLKRRQLKKSSRRKGCLPMRVSVPQKRCAPPSARTDVLVNQEVAAFPLPSLKGARRRTRGAGTSNSHSRLIVCAGRSQCACDPVTRGAAPAGGPRIPIVPSAQTLKVPGASGLLEYRDR